MLTLLFNLEWQAEGVQHKEQFWAEKVSIWRDILPGAMNEILIGKKSGDIITITLEPHQFNTPFSETLIRSILPSQFTPPSEFMGKNYQPELGRFYPKGFLTGVPDVFRVSTAPCRYVDRHDGKMVFNLNHPLAGYYLTISATIMDIDNVSKERGGRCQDWLETISEYGPGMQRLYDGMRGGASVQDTFTRQDESDDGIFYKTPRLVQHLDSTALRLISEQYDNIIPENSSVLDLMGSWDSHLNNNMNISSLTVLGLSDAEMKKNERASKVVLHDLNTTPQLPFKDGAFNAIICTASIEYLTNPLMVLKEAARVLTKEGVIAVSFSDRWFPTKAISVWPHLHQFERLGLVVEMLSATESFESMKTLSVRGYPRPENDPHNHLHISDPVYMVSGRKK